MNKKLLIIANWKMNPDTEAEAKKLFSGIKKKVRGSSSMVVVCPPFPFLSSTSKANTGDGIFLGAQNMAEEERGSYTGEVSVSQLRDMGCRFVILGHSERRALGETSAIVAKKIGVALKHSITPVVCVGERGRGDNEGHLAFVRDQVEQSLLGIPLPALPSVVIAYEPLWAIGKDAQREATPEEIEEMIIFIKKVIAKKYDTGKTPDMRFVYGGSVSPENTESFLSIPVVDGLLVGRASLDASQFGKIVHSAEKFVSKE